MNLLKTNPVPLVWNPSGGITQFSISAHLNTIGNLFDEGVMANNDPYNNSSGYTPLVVYS